MWLDALFAYLHFTAIFTLFGFLACQLILLRGRLEPAAIRLLGKIDLIYFGAAMAALLTGILRLVWGAKGADFYMNAWPFYVKFALFVAVGVISIRPTLTFNSWRRALDHDPGWQVPDADKRRVWRTKMIELHLAAMIPVFAVVMARGLGK